MKKRRLWMRSLAVALSVSMAAGGVFLDSTEVRAEELPEAITFPITLIDFNADNLLFQYDLDDAGEFALTGDVFRAPTFNRRMNEGYDDTYVVQGLVEDELDAKTHKPVYKQETVELVARMVLYQMINPSPKHDTQRFKDLLGKLSPSRPGDAIDYKDITNPAIPSDIFFFSTGDDDASNWQIEDLAHYSLDNSFIKDVSGNNIWQHYYGIYHDSGDTHTLTKTVTGLDSSKTYTLRGGFENEGLSLSLMNKDGTAAVRTVSRSQEGDEHGGPATGTQIERTITVSGSDQITLKVEAAQKGCFLNYLYLEESGRAGHRTLVSNAPTAQFTKSGWQPMPGSDLVEKGSELLDAAGHPQWWFEGDGLVNGGDSSSVYKELSLRAGKTYMVKDLGTPDMKVQIQDMSGSVLVEDMLNLSMFTAPADGRVKIVITGTGDGGETPIWPNRKLAGLCIWEIAENLGTYEDTKNYFADGTKGYADIRNCMDYAYFVLNNFWNAKDGLSWTYGEFNSISLEALDGNGNYGFFADVSGRSARPNEPILYDYEHHNIHNESTGKAGGLFPLELAATSDVDKGQYKDKTGEARNFHYSLHSHATFIYEKDADLYFDFVGDDDVYLFIDNKLVMDIGGAHLAAHNRISLNDLVASGTLDLKEGRAYSFDFFYMERHTEYSNLAIQTNIQLLSDASLNLNFYDENGSPLSSGSKVNSDSQIEIEYEFHVNVDGVKDVNFQDAGLGIEVGKNGLAFGSNIRLKNGRITVIVEKSDGTKEEHTFDNGNEVREFFEDAIFDRDTVVRVRGLMYDVSSGGANLQANASVTYSSPNYAGALDLRSDKKAEDNGNLNVTLVTSSPAPEGPGSKPSNPPKESSPQGNQAAAQGQNARSAEIKSPLTGDDTPIGLWLAVVLTGASVSTLGIGLKRKGRLRKN